LADKIGLKKMLIFDEIFSIVYFGMGFNQNIYVFVEFLRFMESMRQQRSVSVAAAILNEKDTATAIGTYSAFQAFFTMLASSMVGLILYQFGYNRFSSNCICQYFNWSYSFSTPKSSSISCPDYTHLYHNP
jgi:hypothetical protein